MGHKCTLDKKYPGKVPIAQSPIWRMTPLLHWVEKQTLGSPEFTFCCKMAHNVVSKEVKIVSGQNFDSWSISASLSAVVPPGLTSCE